MFRTRMMKKQQCICDRHTKATRFGVVKKVTGILACEGCTEGLNGV